MVSYITVFRSDTRQSQAWPLNVSDARGDESWKLKKILELTLAVPCPIRHMASIIFGDTLLG